MRRLLAIAVWVLVLSVVQVPGACADETGPSLTSGLMRYALDTDRPWLALAYAPAHPEGEPLLLQGEAYQRLGMNDRARSDLDQVVHSGNRKWSALAEMALGFIEADEGHLDKASDDLRQSLQGVKGEAAQHVAYELAELDRQSGHLDLAGQRLGSMPNGRWAAIGYLNLAIAYSKLDTDPSRTLVSLRVADAMIDGQDSPSDNDLRDRINLTAAYVAFKASEYSKALYFLNQIRLNSYYAPAALYLHGLAQARQDNYRGAMQFWHRARKYPLAFPGVADASIGMGLAFDELGYLGEAGDAYLDASSAFEKELVNLKALEKEVRQEGAWKALMVESQRDNVEWFLAQSKSLTTPRMAYVSKLMESGKAQKAAMRVSRLQQLSKQLERESRDLAVFAQMLSQRLAKLEHNRNSGQLHQLEARAQSLQAEQVKLQARLNHARSGDNMEALVSGQLAQDFSKVDALEHQARTQGASASVQARLKRLKGILIWRAQEQEGRDGRLLSQTFDQAKASLVHAHQAIKAFNKELEGAPDHFKALLTRVHQQQARVAQARKTLKGLIARSEQAFDQVALTFFGQQEKLMRSWRDRGNQEVAHLYEYLALSSKQRNDAEGKQKQQGGGQ